MDDFQQIPLPPELVRRLTDAAEESGRSLAEEVAARLRQSFGPQLDVTGIDKMDVLALRELIEVFRQPGREYLLQIGADPATGEGASTHGQLLRESSKPRKFRKYLDSHGREVEEGPGYISMDLGPIPESMRPKKGPAATVHEFRRKAKDTPDSES